MRIAFALMLVFAATVTASADDWRRGRWRAAPLRAWQFRTGNNVWQPGYDSSYYNPYTPNNTSQYGTTTPEPTPVTGDWQPGTPVPNAIPTSPWNGGATTNETTPSTTTTTPTTQTYQSVPGVNSPTNSTTTPTTTTPTTGPTTQNSSRRPSSSASYQFQTPQSGYWNSINGGSR